MPYNVCVRMLFEDLRLFGWDVYYMSKCLAYENHAWVYMPIIGGSVDAGTRSIVWREPWPGAWFNIMAKANYQNLPRPVSRSRRVGQRCYRCPAFVTRYVAASARKTGGAKVHDDYSSSVRYMPIRNYEIMRREAAQPEERKRDGERNKEISR